MTSSCAVYLCFFWLAASLGGLTSRYYGVGLVSGLELRLYPSPDSPGHLDLELSAPVTGYLGLGFSLDGRLSTSDIVIAWVDSDGQPHVFDGHGAPGRSYPIKDSQQDYRPVRGFQNATHTLLTLRRPWDTCDRTGDLAFVNDTMRLIWTESEFDPSPFGGWGQMEWSGPRSILISAPPSHLSSSSPSSSSAGSGSLEEKEAIIWDILAQDCNTGLRIKTIKQNEIPELLALDSSGSHVDGLPSPLDTGDLSLSLGTTPFPSTSRSLEFTLPGDAPSFHWCKIYKVPFLSRKHHVIGYRPVLEEGHSALVEKMILYECLGGSEFEVFGSHPGAVCHDGHRPPEWKACHTPVIVWTSGAEGQFFPEHIGIPVSEGEGKSTYFMLEIHYDNPALQRVRDNSGLRLFLTEKLRLFDSSLLETGIVPSSLQVVPPRQARFTSRGYCDSQCTNLMFPETGIKVFGVIFHTHSTGRQVRLRHLREGRELPVIAQDRYFDPDYQEVKSLSREVTVLPGDDLVTECGYSTLNRTTLTLGGREMRDETCLAYLQYYPRTALASCTSSSQAEFFFRTFGIREFYGQDMELIETKLISQPDKSSPKVHKKMPLQSLLFRFSGKEGFNLDSANPYINSQPGEEDGLFSELVISRPEEFKNKSFLGHLRELPWSERVFTQRLEEILNSGKFRTFCRLQDSTPAMPSVVYNFPNITVPPGEQRGPTVCRRQPGDPNQTSTNHISTILLVIVNIICFYINYI